VQRQVGNGLNRESGNNFHHYKVRVCKINQVISACARSHRNQIAALDLKPEGCAKQNNLSRSADFDAQPSQALSPIAACQKQKQEIENKEYVSNAHAVKARLQPQQNQLQHKVSIVHCTRN
jgi:hypothetical protein